MYLVRGHGHGLSECDEVQVVGEMDVMGKTYQPLSLLASGAPSNFFVVVRVMRLRTLGSWYIYITLALKAKIDLSHDNRWLMRKLFNYNCETYPGNVSRGSNSLNPSYLSK